MKPTIPITAVEEAAAREINTPWRDLFANGVHFANDYHEKHTFPAYESVLKEAREALEGLPETYLSEIVFAEKEDVGNHWVTKVRAALTSITNLTKNNQ